MTWLAGRGFQGVHPAPRSPQEKQTRAAFVRIGDRIVDLPAIYAAPLASLGMSSPISDPCDECGKSLRAATFSSVTWTLRCPCSRIFPVRWRDIAPDTAAVAP
mgnify:CR=1 FL=1